MPELPEVETVCRGLAPVMEGVRFHKVTLNRPDLRFAFPSNFKARLEGKTLLSLKRRAKFLHAELSSGERLFMHLGMSGRFIIAHKHTPHNMAHPHKVLPQHNHVIFEMETGTKIIFNDPRRFGFMELIKSSEPSRLDDLGPEPLSNQFNAERLYQALKGKKSKIKTALLDQHIIAGLGNIYVCEALFRSGISPGRAAGRLSRKVCETLSLHIKDVLRDAIAAGGSSLRDYAGADGELGYFQHQFDVYGREAEPCKTCQTPIKRKVQSGRSSFYCPSCQS